MNKIKNAIEFEDARIGFRNFSGVAGTYNAPGKRNFCVFLNDEEAKILEEDKWNVKYLKPKDEGDLPIPYLQVSISYENIEPKVVLITSKGKTILNESTIVMLDWAEIVSLDLVIRPYNWEKAGKRGIKAYVKEMYVVIAEDRFAEKYKDVPDSAVSSMGE
jgi:hypothetical protein